MSSATVTVRIALVGDENVALPSHRECGAVRRMLGDDVCAESVVRPIPGTRFSTLVGDEPFVGMHYCGYAPAPGVVERLAAAGIVVEATADDAGAEVLELPSNRFFMLSLFQPQIGALAGKPVHPLLREFVACAREFAARRGQAVAGVASSSASS